MYSNDSTQPSTSGLRQLREPAAPALSPAAAGTRPTDDFADVLETMLAGVSDTQQRATRLAESFSKGQEQDLAGVMIAQQKARLSFQTTLQVRNKVVSAYQDIMNMPI